MTWPAAALRCGTVGVALPSAVLAVVVALVLLTGGEPLPPDRVVTDVLGGTTGPLVPALTQLGSGAVLYPVLLFLALLRMSRGDPWTVAALPVLVLVGAQMLEAVAFVTLDRPAPVGTGSISFSSGHAMTAVVGWGLVARQVGGRGAMAGAVAVAAVVGMMRVLGGAHWFTDVLAGWACGALALALHDLLGRRIARDGGEQSVRPEGTAGAHAPDWLRTRWAWALTASAALVPLVPLLTVPAAERMKDLLVYVGAGATAGSGADVYEFRTVYDMPFTYPPFAAMLSEPLARVPLTLLHVLWVVGTLAALVAVARVAMQPVVLRLGLPLTLALLLVSSPVRSHLRFGQVGLFLVLLVSADLLRDGRRRGLGVGLATAVKLTPALFLPLLFVTRQWRALLIAGGAAAGGTAVGLLLLWPSAHEYLWRAVWDSGRFGPNDIPGNQSLRGMLLRSPLDDDAAQLVWLVLSAALVVVALAGARRLYGESDRLAAIGVVAAAAVAVSPISWVHHLVWLVLPISALVAAGRGRIAAGWAALLVVSLPSLGTAGLHSGSGHPALWHLLIDVQGLTAVAAVLVLPALVRARPVRAPVPAR